METKVIKTRKFLPPKDDLRSFLKESINELKENSIVAISSKIVSIGEGRCVASKDIGNKDELVNKEASLYLPRSISPFGRLHTITNGILIGSAGIDESNGNGYYILWPKDPDKSAKTIWEFLRKTFSVKKAGVIITDSNATPLRRGIVGISIAHHGFIPLRDYRGKKDLFGRILKYSVSNIPDSIAAFAVLLMGEAREQTPIVIFEDLPSIKFVQKPTKAQKPYSDFKVDLNDDYFKPFLKSVRWKKGGGSK